MTDVRVLELAGDGDAPHLQLLQDRLEAIAGLPPARGARFRLFELCTPGERGPILWPAIETLRGRAERLLEREDLWQRLLAGELVRLEVTGAPRPLTGTWEALRAQARLQRPMFVVEVVPTEGGPGETRRALEGWRRVLQGYPTAPPRVVRAPPAQPPAAAAAAEETLQTLLADTARFKDSAAVGRLLSGEPEHKNPKMITTRARRAGRIFGVWDGNAYRYPAFQFDTTGQPLESIAALLEVLPRDHDGSWRDAALWLFAPDAALQGQTPADLFLVEPARVIALARARAGGDHALD